MSVQFLDEYRFGLFENGVSFMGIILRDHRLSYLNVCVAKRRDTLNSRT